MRIGVRLGPVWVSTSTRSRRRRRPSQPSWHATGQATTPDGRGVDFRCRHSHRSQDAAINCAATIRKQIERGQSLHLITRVRSTPATREAARQRAAEQEARRQAKAAQHAQAAQQRTEQREARRQAKAAERDRAAQQRQPEREERIARIPSAWQGGPEMTDRQDYGQQPPQEYGQQHWQDQSWRPQHYDPGAHERRISAQQPPYPPEGPPWHQPGYGPQPGHGQQSYPDQPPYNSGFPQPGQQAYGQRYASPQPAYGPPGGPQRRKPWAARHKLLTAFLAFCGLVFVIGIAAAAGSSSSSSTPAPVNSSPAAGGS